MKRIFYISLTIGFFFQSCSTDLDLTSDWKDIPVVYGMLNRSDDTTFIKITKAFLDPKISATSIAQNPDSLYYKNLTVFLKEYDSKDTLTNSFPLLKVDGNLIGHSKNDKDGFGNSGAFATAPNYLYMTTEKISGNRSYKLVISNGDNGKEASASTEVIDSFVVSAPTGGQKISLFPINKFTVRWKSAKDGKVYGLIARFHYKEFNSSTNMLLKDTYLDWELFSNVVSSRTVGGDDMNYTILGSDFYYFLNASIADNPNVYRVAGKLDFTFSVGGESYYTYTQVASAHTGLTSGQVLPEYSNIENGMGLFSSRGFKAVNGVELQFSTVDSLACGNITKHLSFLNSSGGICP